MPYRLWSQQNQLAMLHSPKPPVQRQPQRDNPILEPKSDLQRRIQRPSQPRAIAPSTAQRVAPRKQQHRRHLSVPDNVLMSIASASVEERIHDDFKLYHPIMMNNGGNDVMGPCADRPRQTTDANIRSTMFLHSAQQKSGTLQVQIDQSTF
jgi:hypothetical protein